MGSFKLSLLLGRGSVGRLAFWLLWPFVAVPWAWLWFQPDAACQALLWATYPTVCLFTLRLHDAGRSGWWFATAWLAFLAVVFWGLGGHVFHHVLAEISRWPGGMGLFDIGPSETIVAFALATLGFLALSLAFGLARPVTRSPDRATT